MERVEFYRCPKLEPGGFSFNDYKPEVDKRCNRWQTGAEKTMTEKIVMEPTVKLILVGVGVVGRFLPKI